MKPPHERRTALTHLVEAEGVARVNPPMLLEANQYFELAGEEFGRSLLMTIANDGVEYCLRPEFTIPIVSQYVTQGLAGSPVAYGYMGQVFRQDDAGPHEYVQAGVELLGQLDPEQALDEVLTFARRAPSRPSPDHPRYPPRRRRAVRGNSRTRTDARRLAAAYPGPLRA